MIQIQTVSAPRAFKLDEKFQSTTQIVVLDDISKSGVYFAFKVSIS